MSICLRKMDSEDLAVEVTDPDILGVRRARIDSVNRLKRLREELEKEEHILARIDETIREWETDVRNECDCGCPKVEAA